jgi:hypothetical protein
MRVNVLALAFLGLVGMSTAFGQRPAETSDDKSDRPEISPQTIGPAAVPAGQTARYIATYVKSNTTSGFRTATVVTVTNNSPVTCSVSVDWFAGFSTTASCTTNISLSSGHTADFCSRSVPSGVTTCNSTCSPEQTFLEGRAQVASTADAAGKCAALAVENRVYYLTGTTFDTGVAAVSNSKIIRIGESNK